MSQFPPGTQLNSPTPPMYQPTLNIPQRYQKGLIKLMGGLAAPFYTPTSVVVEGMPMKFSATPNGVDPTAGGDGASIVGLSMQVIYDDVAWGQLRGYQLVNNTWARLGSVGGLLTGTGYALTTFYAGAVAWAQPAYINPVAGADFGKMTASGVSANLLPVVFEGSGTEGNTPVRIRFNFKLV